MTVINICYGLGNQLFQYALGRKLALENDEPLVLDISSCGHSSLGRQFQLNNFCAKYSIMDKTDLRSQKREYFFMILLHRFSCNPILLRLFGINYHSNINVALRKKLNRFFKKVFLEESPLYGDSVFKLAKGRYVSGLWQTEKYFADIADIIRADLRCKIDVSPENHVYLSAINNSNSIAIHIRRGDFLNNTRYFNIIGLDYYEKAIKYVSEHIDNPHFFVFSNDLKWAQENLKCSSDLTFVDGNDETNALQDFIMMTKCKHHIIANSTFSWWGAWLAEYDHQIVVAPHHARWLKNVDCRDMIPERWVQI